MNRFVESNPGVQDGVDTKCCSHPISEILTAVVAMKSCVATDRLIVDGDAAEDRSWSGTLCINAAGNGGDPLRIPLRLHCSARGWYLRANRFSAVWPEVEESWPLFLQFIDVDFDLSTAERVQITITE